MTHSNVQCSVSWTLSPLCLQPLLQVRELRTHENESQFPLKQTAKVAHYEGDHNYKK